jgi:hypothetical protein
VDAQAQLDLAVDVSYLSGAVILAVTINLLTGLSK